MEGAELVGKIFFTWLTLVLGLILLPSAFGVSLGISEMYMKILVKTLEVSVPAPRRASGRVWGWGPREEPSLGGASSEGQWSAGCAFRFILRSSAKTASAELERSGLGPLDHSIGRLLYRWLSLYPPPNAAVTSLSEVFTAPGFRGPFLYQGIRFMLKIRNQLLNGRKKI